MILKLWAPFKNSIWILKTSAIATAGWTFLTLLTLLDAISKYMKRDGLKGTLSGKSFLDYPFPVNRWSKLRYTNTFYIFTIAC
jgi:hypothetical protein